MWWQNKHISPNQLSFDGEFLGITTPEEGDIVIFNFKGEGHRYVVKHRYLERVDGNNRRIFSLLGLNRGVNETKLFDFCKKAYGYEAGHGECPECRENDMKALGRLIFAIKLECDKINKLNVVAQ